jgi:hypothetical protein
VPDGGVAAGSAAQAAVAHVAALPAWQRDLCADLREMIRIYDPTAPDPAGLVNQGQGNRTARSIQVYEGDEVDRTAVIELLRSIAARNRAGGWRRLDADT